MASNIFHRLGEFGSKHSSGLWMGAAGGFFAATIFCAIKDSPRMHKSVMCTRRMVKASQSKEEEKRYKKQGTQELLKLSVPTAVCAIGTIGCAMASLKASGKKIAGLSFAYGTTRELLRDYQAEVREEVGEAKEQKIRDRVKERRMVDPDREFTELPRLANTGDYIIFDETCNYRFESNGLAITAALQRITAKLQSGQSDWIPINDFYFEVSGKTVSMGDQIGWSVDDAPIECYYKGVLDDNDRPMAAILYTVTPKAYIRR